MRVGGGDDPHAINEPFDDSEMTALQQPEDEISAVRGA